MMRAHFARIVLVAAAVLTCALTFVTAAPQEPRSAANIWSPAYDVRIEVLPDGSLDIVESVTLAVGAKAMTWFDREIPIRRTDGFTNVVALMDGQAVPVSIKNKDDLKIRWDFSPTANAIHKFEIRYRALHVLAREIDGPRLVWTALPRRHTYPIESSEITLFAPAGSIATEVSAPGGEVLPATKERTGVVIAGHALGRDRAVTVEITFAPNSIKPVEPQWFVDQNEQLNMLPAWLAGAACVLVVGVGILIMMFARLPRPPALEADGGFVSPASDGSVAPGVASLLIARAQSNSWLALQAAFFRMVRDGVLVVEKRSPGRLRWPAFNVTLGAERSDGIDEIAPHEAWILDGIRRETANPDLRRVMMRLSRRQREFRTALTKEAIARGWIDIERQRARTGLMATALVLVFAGLLGAMAVLALPGRLGLVPVVVPASLFLVGFIYLIVSAAMSVLSEAGFREAAAWRARVAELKSLIKTGVSGQSLQDFERWFPLAIGAGIGRRWLKAFAPQLAAGSQELGWLNAMGSPADAAASLAMLVAISGASHSGGSGGAGGGAGGGSSGAG